MNETQVKLPQLFPFGLARVAGAAYDDIEQLTLPGTAPRPLRGVCHACAISRSRPTAKSPPLLAAGGGPVADPGHGGVENQDG